MNEPASSSKVCGRCGAKLPFNAPEGLCPRCLGALNLTGETVFTETESPRPPPPSPERIAVHFPQLEIIECLGRGGMGIVYKARQKLLGRLVALKLLAPEREMDPQFADRFAREAQALAQLDHPHIVTVYDFGQTNGFFYLLMEFVDGVNLRQLLRSRKLTPEEALAIVPPLCEALQFAHERGIVHRDIKPENLLLAKDGRIKVADFGIAKMLGDEAQIAEEKAAGTPGYMAPEQMERPSRVDSRADIYSLGVVFYEMLTGELPAKQFAPPSRKVAVDVRIDEVVLRALERAPELRWQTAAEMRTSIEQVAATSHRSSAQAHGTAAASRSSRWALLPLALIAAIVCGFLASSILSGFRFAPLISAVIAFAVPVAIGVLVEGRHRAGANGLATVPSPYLLMAVLAAMPVLIIAGYGALQVTPARPIVASPQPPPAAAKTPFDGGRIAPGLPQSAVEAAPVTPASQFTPSEAEPASGSESSNVRPRVSAEGDWQLSRLVSGRPENEKESVTAPALWVPSEPPVILTFHGQKVTAFWAGQDGGEIAWQSPLNAAICAAGAWDANSRRIYLGTTDGRFHALDAQGRRRWSIMAGGKVVTQPAVADGVVIFGCDDHQVYGVNAETGAAKWTFGATASATSAPATTAGLIVIGSTDGSAHALDPQTGAKKWSYEGMNPGTNSVYPPILGARDEVLLTTSGGEVIALDCATGGTRWTAKLDGATDTALAIGRDDCFVVEGGTARCLDLRSGRLIWQTAVEGYIGAPRVFDNSLIIARRRGAVRRLDFAGSVREEWTVPKSDSRDGTVAFRFGPMEGGEALWLLDEKGAIWRLGPTMRASKDAKQR